MSDNLEPDKDGKIQLSAETSAEDISKLFKRVIVPNIVDNYVRYAESNWETKLNERELDIAKSAIIFALPIMKQKGLSDMEELTKMMCCMFNGMFVEEMTCMVIENKEDHEEALKVFKHD